jgi:hypothetical protein
MRVNLSDLNGISLEIRETENTVTLCYFPKSNNEIHSPVKTAKSTEIPNKQ